LIGADFSENFSKGFLDQNWRPKQRILAKFTGITEDSEHKKVVMAYGVYNTLKGTTI
jgi:hypothetical protein